VLLACGTNGLVIYDVSLPYHPKQVAHVVESGGFSANQVATANGYVYLANGWDGLRIYQLANVIAAAPGSFFQGDGSGLTNVLVNAANLSGRVSVTNLPTNVAYVDANQTFSGSNVFSAGRTVFTGNVGIGTNAPAAALDVRAQSQNAVWSETTGDWNGGVVGKNNSSYNHTIGIYGEAVNGRGVYGISENLAVMGYTHYGTAVYGLVESANGCAGQFSISFTDSTNAALSAFTAGTGPALRAEAALTNGVALEIKTGGLRVTGAGINTGTFALTHRAVGTNTSNNYTTIYNPLTDGDPNAIVIVTHNYNADTNSTSQYNTEPVGVWYNGSRWTIYNENNTHNMALGRAFNVLVIKP
jgi:hypothetical protein